MLSAYVRDNSEPGFGAVVSLGVLPCRKTLLKTADGEQHILLNNCNEIVQLQCIGEDIRVDPIALELVIDTFPDVDGAHRLLKRLADIYQGRRKGRQKSEWTVEATRHRDALAALDLRMTGKSYREIALFLYGEKAVNEDWGRPDQTMKNRVIRSVKRGTRMMQGDYRKLLS